MPELDQLTERQLRVYEFIRDKIQTRGYGPTVREIGEHFQISSPNGVMCHLKALERKGLIRRGRKKSRAIELTQEAPASFRGLPLVGRVAAGVLHEAVEQSDVLNVGALFGSGELLALTVRGDSMIEAQIADGDYVIVRRQPTARSGDMVVARTPEGEATLKFWFPEKGRIRLQPANAAMEPLYVAEAEIVGVVVGVVRKV